MCELPDRAVIIGRDNSNEIALLNGNAGKALHTVWGDKPGRVVQLEHSIGTQNHKIYGLHWLGFDIMQKRGLPSPPIHLHYHIWPNFNQHHTLWPTRFK